MFRTRLACGVSAVALAAAMLPVAGLLAGPAAAANAPILVTSGADTLTAGTLRTALVTAQQSGDDLIEITAGLTITATDELSITGSGALTINGNGATLTGPGVEQGLVNDDGEDLSINDLTITGFGAASSDDAAPIVSFNGAVTLHNCSITGNHIQSDDGDVAGGVLTEGGEDTLTLDDCDISGNSATTTDGDAGGAVVAEGNPVIVAVSTITANTGTATDGDAAGGILSEGGPVTVRNSTINCNAATAAGDAAGGILSEGADLTINGSTVVGNSATGGEFSDNSLLAPGNDINGTGNTISDDASSCAVPPPPPPPPPPGPAPVVAPARFTG